MVDAEYSNGWSCEMEVNLFHAMRCHKPVGVNRYFQMVFIHEKMQNLYKKLSTKQIWDCLMDMYDLQALNESEIVPFPNKENDFMLPESEFSELKEKNFPRLVQPKPSEETKSEGRQDKHEKSETNVKPTKPDSRHSMGTPIVLATPDNSPKRKRTRHTPSSTASPATPDAPPVKRRR